MRANPIRCAAAVALAVVILPSCKGGKLRSRGGSAAEIGEIGQGAPTRVLGGTIRLVRDSLGFVLIKSAGSGDPPMGSILAVHRSGDREPVAELRLSPEKKMGFIVADIVSGKPEVGDTVLWSMPDAPPTPGPAPALPGGEAEVILPPGLEQFKPPTFDDMPPLGPVGTPAGRGAVTPLDPETELEMEIRRGGGSLPPQPQPQRQPQPQPQRQPQPQPQPQPQRQLGAGGS